MAEASYTAKACALVNEAAKDCAAVGERMDKLGEDIENLLVDAQLDARERMIQFVRALLERDLPAHTLEERAYIARRIGDHRAADFDDAHEEDPLDEWAARLVDGVYGPMLGGTQ